MKKHLFTFAIVVSAIFLSSCSMVKRHYTNGYYVSHSSNEITNKVQEPVVDKKTAPALYTVQNTPNNVVNLKPISLAENGSISASNKQTISKNAPVVMHKKHLGYNAPKIMQTKENAKILSAKKPNPDTVVVDALSLFWIVILILLILWLVAILTGGWGLGLFVHAILLVALILLILWLLRVI
jgi:hypothetical protein